MPSSMTTGRMKRDTQISIRLPSELRATLQRLADADKRSLASYIMLVLDEHAGEKVGK